MTKQKVQNRDVNAATRVAQAVQLRAQKYTYEQIAQRAGYGSAAACYNAIQRELQRSVVENVEELRREELHMLDQLHQECWEIAMDKGNKGRLFAVDRLLVIAERRAKLVGLDKRVEDAGIQVIIEEVPIGYLEGPKE